MTLRRKMTVQIAAMIVGLLLVSGASLWGINGLHQDYGVALSGYERLRQVYEAGSHLATAQKMLRMPHRETLRAARDEVRAAATSYAEAPPAEAPWDAAADAAVRTGLRDLVARFEASDGAAEVPERELAAQQRDAVSDLMGRIARLASGVRGTIEASQEAARAKRRATIASTAVLCGAVVLAAVLLGAVQYMSVIRPLRRLGEGVKRVAAGHFRSRIDAAGRDEFASLAADFNRMAGELDGFYNELEQKVAAKSKELIRSERLASVGYLAAGVAHEINNPLGIISGYAEYSLGELHGGRTRGAAAGGTRATTSHETDAPLPPSSAPAGLPDDVRGEVEKSLRIICDEAFRCKAITGKLLSLARQGDEARRAVSLADVADHVGSIVGGLREHRGRRLIVQAEDRGRLVVNAVEAEMKQVLLNLVVNALEAVPADAGGTVRVDVRRDDGWVELSVTDNGRGMTPETLERAFEPFFTDRRGARDDAAAGGSHGTGLGLSITHAIVQAHGGRIEASSAGPGQGSRFVVRLPAADQGDEDGG